jgi:hypothetical protein
MTVTVNPWIERGKVLRSCLAQSGPSRTDNKGWALFGLRDGPCIHEFSTDTLDHEIARLGKAARPHGFQCARRDIQVFEMSNEKFSALIVLPAVQPCVFCTEKESKALALCAARSHIVAVR